MLRNLFNFKKQKEPLQLKENAPENEFMEISQNLDNFVSLLQKSSSKNLILKDYDILDLRLIEFINKHGRNSIYGEKAVELSQNLSKYYNYFKAHINLYTDEPISKKEEKKEEPKLNFESIYDDLRKRLNNFKESVKTLTEDEIENFILLFNDEIREIVKKSDKDYKFKFIDLKNKLISFYKNIQSEYEEHEIKQNKENNLNLANSSLNSFKSGAESLNSLINLKNKTEHQILEINNRLFEIKEKYIETKEIISTRLSESEKESFLKNLDSSYSEVNSRYIAYLEKLASLEKEKSVKIELPIRQISVSFFDVLKSFKPSPVFRLRTNKNKIRKKQQLMAEQTVNILTEVLNNVDVYDSEELKDIFTNNFAVYEKFILNTDYSMLVKSLLDDLENNINKFDEEKKSKVKRDAIAKDSYNLLKNVNSSLENYTLEELQVMFEKNLEQYKNFSKYTMFGLRINSYLNQLNSYINTLSNRRTIHEDMSKIFLNNLNQVISNFENYSVAYLSNVLEKSTDEYNKYYRNSKFARNIEFSLQSISNTFSLLTILISYIEKDLLITEKQRVFLRNLVFNTYSQFFSFGTRFLFNLSSRRSLNKLEKVFNLEIERKLMLEDVNNKIISLNLSHNAYIKLLINNLINAKKHQSNADLKETFLELSNKISKNDKDSLNEAIVKLMELTNTTLPLRKKSLLELRTKLL